VRPTVRNLVRLAVVVTASAAVVGMATTGVGVGERFQLAGGPSTSGPGATVEPTPFAKQAAVGTDKTAPTTIEPPVDPSASTAVTAGSARPAPGTTAVAVPVPGPVEGPAPAADVAPPPPAAPVGARCIVRLHGKGGGAGATRTVSDGLVEVAPGGNGAAWGGREWAYFPESGYAAATANVAAAIDAAGCGRVILNGFSNGGAFAAKLYCRGETFGGRVVGVVVDDPVVDHAVVGCRPASGVRIALYWTGALDSPAVSGWSCAEQDWTCEGGTTIGIDAYAAALGVSRKASASATHAWYQHPPELTSWW
jgi:pimeloyl-ACP methyl ester carboxylesterase